MSRSDYFRTQPYAAGWLHPHVKKELGQQFIDWLISHEGQRAIANYKIDGEQVFWPQQH
jgi:ABC-type tungstate transport system permease subunit